VIFLEQIPSILQRLEAYEKLYIHSMPLRMALSKVYLELLDFLRTTIAVFRKEQKSSLGKVGLRILQVALWKDHKSTFGARMARMKELCHETEQEATLSSRQDASEFHKDSRAFMNSESKQSSQWI
jgi:hypothetical protein